MYEKLEQKIKTEILCEIRKNNSEIQKLNFLLEKIYDAFQYQEYERKKEYVSTAEAGVIISKTKYTILRWIKSGRIEAVCINRRYFIEKSSLSRFMKKGTTKFTDFKG